MWTRAVRQFNCVDVRDFALVRSDRANLVLFVKLLNRINVAAESIADTFEPGILVRRFALGPIPDDAVILNLQQLLGIGASVPISDWHRSITKHELPEHHRLRILTAEDLEGRSKGSLFGNFR